MSELNGQQVEAVHHVEGPLLVLAGAGSGKTRVVTHRIAHLIEKGISPSDILAVTFTNRAAAEMRARIAALKNAQVLACTFHSLGARILRESIGALGYGRDFTIYDEEDSEKLLKECLDSLGIGKEKGVLRQVRLGISAAKNDLIASEEVKEDRVLAEAYALYQRKLKECNAVDFDDLLYLTVKMLQEFPHVRAEYQNRWLFVLIDEYQDTNFSQYTLVKILVEKHTNLFAVGDPDQSIYSWRGARYQNILNFESDFPGAKVVTLDQNYRSTNTILQGANALIQQNVKRLYKELWSELGEGEKIGLYVGHNEKMEAEFVAKRIYEALGRGVSLSEMAIFYRTNAQSRTFEDILLLRKIPYTIIGGVSFYDRREVKDLLSYLRMILSNSDLISFLRTVQIPRRGLGQAAVDKIVLAATEKGMPIFTFAEEAEGCKLSSRQREGLREYVRTIRSLREKAAHLSIHELIAQVIAEVRYVQYLQEDPETAQDRKENVDELLSKAAEWEEEQEEPTLAKFLEELSLRVPAPEEEQTSAIKMMTLHHSKGLEFHTVFLVGLEEDLFPHINSKDDPEKLEEERRLCYVGMTRAMQNLYLSAATYRYMWGASRLMRPSRFLKEIPQKYLHSHAPLILEKSFP